ncbi:MerR family transcriptional regulator [Streptosporangium vulgare]|uniref:MerR family transcriptional regulator n=1 Tax=Streptosporangium vulgare TaxID=46190 RepID=UPI0031D9E4DD
MLLIDESHGQLLEDRRTLQAVEAAAPRFWRPCRRSCGDTLSALARRLGIRSATLRKWENAVAGAPRPRSSDGYRIYSAADVRDVRLCHHSGGAAVPAEQIAPLIAQGPLRRVLAPLDHRPCATGGPVCPPGAAPCSRAPPTWTRTSTPANPEAESPPPRETAMARNAVASVSRRAVPAPGAPRGPGREERADVVDGRADADGRRGAAPVVGLTGNPGVHAGAGRVCGHGVEWTAVQRPTAKDTSASAPCRRARTWPATGSGPWPASSSHAGRRRAASRVRTGPWRAPPQVSRSRA